MHPLKRLATIAGVLMLSVSASDVQRQPNSTVTLTLNREYGRASYASCRLIVALSGGSGGALLHCAYAGTDGNGQPIPPLRAEEELPADEANALLDLVGRANLYKGEASGTDETPGDGVFETLTVTTDGRVVVLVTTGNPSFLQYHPRRELRSQLVTIEKRLLDKGSIKGGSETC
jgi:hypothetical protein